MRSQSLLLHVFVFGRIAVIHTLRFITNHFNRKFYFNRSNVFEGVEIN